MYTRQVDRSRAESAGPDERIVQRLLHPDSGGGSACAVSWIHSPAGHGSPEGMHTHEVDQIFYVLEGQMDVVVGGEATTLDPGGLVAIPAGTPHRNWNGGSTPSVHLAISAPAPETGRPFAIPVTD